MCDYGRSVDCDFVVKLTDYGVGVCREYEAGSGDFLCYRICAPFRADCFDEVWFGTSEQAVDYFNLHKNDEYIGEDGECYGLGYWLDIQSDGKIL